MQDKNGYKTTKIRQKSLFLIFLFIALQVGSYLVIAQEYDVSRSSNGTDPTEPRTRFDAYLARIEPLSSGYILQTTVAGAWSFKNRASIGINIPLVYADFPSSVTFEVGDIHLNGMLALYQKSNQETETFGRVSLGAEVYLNTGNVETGTGFGHYMLAPYLGFSYYPASELMITPLIEEFISLDKNESNRQRNDLSLRFNSTLTIDNVWVTLVPELVVDLLGKNKNLWTLRSSLGYMFTSKTGISAELISELAGEKRFNYLGQVSFRYLLNR